LADEETIRLPCGYGPRNYQIGLMDCLANGYKRACVVWHRRAGKDKTMINIVAREMFKRVGGYYYMFPKLNQGRRVLWEGMDRTGYPHMNHIPERLRKSTSKTEMMIEAVNGSIFRVIGTDHFDVSMGTNPVGLIFSEYALQDPRVWGFFLPILMENDGWAIFNFTPRGKNHAYDIYNSAKANPDTWFSELLTVDDTKIAITAKQIDQIRKENQMSEDMIKQEFYCSFEASNPGAYYGKEMARALEQRRICRIPVETGIPVNTFWDLGIDDSTSIWLVQFIGKEVRLIGYYEDSGEGLAHYANWLGEWRAKRGCTFEKHVLPHDGAVRDLSTGKSRKQFLEDLGLTCEIAKRPDKKEDGIESSRQMLGRIWFEETECSQGIEGLRNYKKEFNEEHGVFKTSPVHDKNCHPADAFQTLSLWFDEHGFPKPPPNLTKLYGVTPEPAYKW